MKKFLVFLLTLSMVTALAACGSEADFPSVDCPSVPTPPPALAEATVVALDYGLMVVSEETGLCSVSTDNLTLPEDLSVGDTISITWPGAIQESYPGGIGGVTSIEITQQGNDRIGAYREAFASLRDADSNLDSDVAEMALDFTGISTLTQLEKEGLLYLLSCDADLFGSTYPSTFEDLVDSSAIVDDGFASFEHGVLYIFEETQTHPDGFTFNMEKWRSSLGAYGVQDCEVVFDNDGNFTLTTGDAWIS